MGIKAQVGEGKRGVRKAKGKFLGVKGRGARGYAAEGNMRRVGDRKIKTHRQNGVITVDVTE